MRIPKVIINAVILGTCIVSFAAFYLILVSTLGGFMKFLLSIVLLGVTGYILRALSGADGWSGLLLVKLKEGIALIDWMRDIIGENWNRLCDIGLVLSFGAVSGAAFKHINRKTLVVSLLILAGYTFFVIPYLYPIAMMLMNIPPTDSASGGGTSTAPVVLTVIFIFGLVGLLLFGLLMKAVSVLAAIVAFALGDSAALSPIMPGATLVLPGITLPLVEGIIALVILMVVHEGAHGISARLSRIRIKSTGVLTFGFLPVGAFVDIDEKQLDDSREADISRVAVAGSTANLLTCFLFLIPTILLLIALPAYYDNKVVVAALTKNIPSATNVSLSVGSVIESINGMEIKNISQFTAAAATVAPNSSAIIGTDKGIVNVSTDANGKVGVFVAQPIKEEFWYIKSLFAILGLTTVLNFLIGAVNLIPLPGFDGYRLFKIGLKRDIWVNTSMIIVLVAFILNIVPWLWH